MRYVSEFKHNGELVAILVKREFQNSRMALHANFISRDSQSLQLGVGHYPRNYVGPPHTHAKVRSEVHYEELLHLVRGRMKVDLYGNDRDKIASLVLGSGDTIHFVSRCH